MSWLFIGSNPLSGIGQVTKRYAEMSGGDFVEKGVRPPKAHYKNAFYFMLPFDSEINLADDYRMYCDEMMIMTICETEPVNDAYKMIADRYPVIYVASDYCKDVFTRQYPNREWRVLRLFAPTPHVYRPPKEDGPYVFYTIGNIADPRKNINGLLQVFMKYQHKWPNSRLLMKATCNSEVKLDIPGVIVINGLISLEQMENIHAQGHCYINCSHSEGVGMGAVEAALRSKPVIITDYGGLKEYVKTPWVVPCTKGKIGFDDFLFKADHEWGHPDMEVLAEHMADCYAKKVKTWEHAHTQGLMDEVKQSFEC